MGTTYFTIYCSSSYFSRRMECSAHFRPSHEKESGLRTESFPVVVPTLCFFGRPTPVSAFLYDRILGDNDSRRARIILFTASFDECTGLIYIDQRIFIVPQDQSRNR